MADIYSHSKLAKEVVNKLEKSVDYNNLFLGAQGPDPFYYNFFSSEHSEYRSLADLMHNKDTRKTLTGMVNYLEKNYSHKLYSFVIGFITHYALDVHIHPYIYNKVGIYNKNDEQTHSYRGLHLKFERAIDCVLIEKDTEMKPHKYSLTKNIIRTDKVDQVVVDMFDVVLKKVYAFKDCGKMYQIATTAMYKNMKNLVYDPFGIKSFVFKIVDFFKRSEDLFMRDLTFYNRIEDYDYLNIKNNVWNHPVTNDESTKSIPEILIDAQEFAISMIDQVDLYLKDKKQVKLADVFTNLSLNTGLNCDRKKQMQYFNIYNKKWI